MSEEAENQEAAAPKPKPPLSTILVFANTLFVLGALGTFVYTKILYKKPVVTESQELEKKKAEAEKPKTPVEKQLVSFDQIMANMAPTQGKPHFVTVTLSVEARDEVVARMIEEKKAILLDKLISLLGRKEMYEVNTIQGKLLLKTQLIRDFNQMIVPGGITDVYFATFVLQ